MAKKKPTLMAVMPPSYEPNYRSDASQIHNGVIGKPEGDMVAKAGKSLNFPGLVAGEKSVRSVNPSQNRPGYGKYYGYTPDWDVNE